MCEGIKCGFGHIFVRVEEGMEQVGNGPIGLKCAQDIGYTRTYSTIVVGMEQVEKLKGS